MNDSFPNSSFIFFELINMLALYLVFGIPLHIFFTGIISLAALSLYFIKRWVKQATFLNRFIAISFTLIASISPWTFPLTLAVILLTIILQGFRRKNLRDIKHNAPIKSFFSFNLILLGWGFLANLIWEIRIMYVFYNPCDPVVEWSPYMPLYSYDDPTWPSCGLLGNTTEEDLLRLWFLLAVAVWLLSIVSHHYVLQYFCRHSTKRQAG